MGKLDRSYTFRQKRIWMKLMGFPRITMPGSKVNESLIEGLPSSQFPQ